jgi:hypothetical protein
MKKIILAGVALFFFTAINAQEKSNGTISANKQVDSVRALLVKADTSIQKTQLQAIPLQLDSAKKGKAVVNKTLVKTAKTVNEKSAAKADSGRKEKH